MDKLQFGLSPSKVAKNMSRTVPKSQMFKVSPAFSEQLRSCCSRKVFNKQKILAGTAVSEIIKVLVFKETVVLRRWGSETEKLAVKKKFKS